MNIIQRLISWLFPQPVKIAPAPCPICADWRAKIAASVEADYGLLAEVQQRALNTHIASAHTYPNPYANQED